MKTQNSAKIIRDGVDGLAERSVTTFTINGNSIDVTYGIISGRVTSFEVIAYYFR